MVNNDEIKPKSPKSPLILNYSVYLALFIVILLAFTFFFSLFAKYKASQHQEQILNQINQIKNEQSGLAKQNQRLEKKLADANNQIQKLSKALQNNLSKEAHQNQQLLLQKARFYLDLAKANAYWSFDQKTTLTLLKAADTILIDSLNPQVVSVRKAITDEIQQINEEATLDRIGILNQINKIKTNLLTLPLKTSFSNPLKPQVTPASGLSNWREELRQSMAFLEKLVVIQKQETTMDALLTPLYKSIVKENIIMNLQVAEWALLENQAGLFQQSLDSALIGIQSIFDIKANPTKVVIQEIQQLKSLSLAKPKPMIGQSLELIGALIQNSEGKP